MPQTTNEQIHDLLVRHAVEGQRFSRGTAAKIVELLDSMDEALTEKLAARLVAITERGIDIGPASTKRLERLLAEVRALNSQVYSKLSDVLTDELTAFAVEEADFHAGALNKAIPIEFAATLPTPTMLRTLVETSPMEGHLLKHWTDGMEEGRMKRVEAALRKGIAAGDSTDNIVRSIIGTRKNQYRDGVLEVSRRSATSIVRTATSHVSNVAAQATYKANERVVRGWAFIATLDSRTTITCAALSQLGKVYPIGEGPMPPRHIRCRSTAIPVTKSYRELGLDKDEITPEVRASMDGLVPADIKFSDWLTNKGEAMQNEVLGPKRAQLFREGKLKLEDLIEDDGSVLTLNELRAKHASILR